MYYNYIKRELQSHLTSQTLGKTRIVLEQSLPLSLHALSKAQDEEAIMGHADRRSSTSAQC